MLCRVVHMTSATIHWPCSPVCVGFFFLCAVSVVTKSLKLTKDQKQTNKRKLRGERSPAPQCHVAEQKECQGFNVPRLYHSALSFNAAVLVVLTALQRAHSRAALAQPHIRLSGGWIWAGSSVLRPRKTDTPVVFSGSALRSLLLL